MWLIAALLLISFALIVLVKIAQTWRMYWIFLSLEIAVWIVIMKLLYGRNFSEFTPILGLAISSSAVSDLIKVPIWRSRVVPPCVRVKIPGQIWANIIYLFFAFLFVVFLIYLPFIHGWRPFGMTAYMGFTTAAFITWFILILFEKIEICGNGLWRNGGLQPWKKYESFSWNQYTTDGNELRLVSKSGLFTSLVVPPEDRQTVQQILEPNLPELTAKQ